MKRMSIPTVPSINITKASEDDECVGQLQAQERFKSPEHCVDETYVTKRLTGLTLNSRSRCSSFNGPDMSVGSRLSTITVNAEVFRNILANRDSHNIFSSMDEDVDCSRWFYQSGSNEVEGPFDSFEMDNRFKEFKVNEDSKIKREGEEEFVSLVRLIKRYYTNVVAYQDKARMSKASSRGGRTHQRPLKSPKKQRPEVLIIYGRDDRVVSAVPRPQLAFFNPTIEHNDEEEEQLVSRARSQTLTD